MLTVLKESFTATRKEDEDQTRGFPLGHAGLATLKMLDEWNRAELAAARDEANSIGAYTAPQGREQEIADLTDPENSDVAHNLMASSEPGMKLVLPMGWDYKSHTPTPEPRGKQRRSRHPINATMQRPWGASMPTCATIGAVLIMALFVPERFQNAINGW